MVVEHVAVIAALDHLPAALALGLQRRPAHQPPDDLEAVGLLLAGDGPPGHLLGVEISWEQALNSKVKPGPKTYA